MRRKRTLQVNTMYGADGRLRTSYFEGDAANMAKKHVRSFEKELNKYEKDFATYASLDIETTKVHALNTKFIMGKLGVAEKYVDFIPEGDMAECLGDEMTAIAGNKKAQKLGIKAKIASKFQPFFERQAKKHPRLQALADRVTKAANGGRMPLTADSAAMMRIAFDKKYYNDCRKPGANIEELQCQHTAAIENLTKMARYDGVEKNELSAKFAEKLITQMQIDESLTDIYAGMATGNIRLADAKPVRDARGEIVRVGGKTLFDRSMGFVSAERDKNGNNLPLDAWNFDVREPQTVDEILYDYQTMFDKYANKCQTEGDLKRMLASNSFANLERNAKAFAEADCPDDADMFKYEFSRCNLASCKKWAIGHGYMKPYADINVPPPWTERASDFMKSYSTDDYYSVDPTEIHDRAVEDITTRSDEQLKSVVADDCAMTALRLEAMMSQLNRLEKENQELREKLSQMRRGVNVIDVEAKDFINEGKTALPSKAQWLAGVEIDTTIDDDKSTEPEYG